MPNPLPNSLNKQGFSWSKPQYLQIKDALANQILAGPGPNDKLLRAAAGELYGTTRVTIREALVQLEANGLIYREDRRGWFVTPPRFSLNPRRTSNFHQIVREQGRTAYRAAGKAARRCRPR